MDFPQLSTAHWALAMLIGLSVGSAKAGLPGMGLLVVPLMTELFPGKASTGVLLPMLIFADVCAVTYYHRHADWSKLKALLPSAMLGVGVGFWAMRQIDDHQFKFLVGAIVLAMMVLMLLNRSGWLGKGRLPEGKRFAYPVGALVGVTTMMANSAGPIAAIYFLALRMEKTGFIGTSAWFFLIINLFKVPFSYQLGYIHSQSLSLNAAVAPAIAVGMLIGIQVVKRINNRVFFRLVFCLILFSALKLMLR